MRKDFSLLFSWRRFLPTAWAWNHGLYNRDHKLVATQAHLTRFLASTDFPRQLKAGEPWPAPGIRVRKCQDRYEIACMAARMTRGLLDLEMAVGDGKATSLRVRKIYVSGHRTFY